MPKYRVEFNRQKGYPGRTDAIELGSSSPKRAAEIAARLISDFDAGQKPVHFGESSEGWHPHGTTDVPAWFFATFDGDDGRYLAELVVFEAAER